ncbi:hypothetical protein D9M71_238230 [compost metagenome]
MPIERLRLGMLRRRFRRQQGRLLLQLAPESAQLQTRQPGQPGQRRPIQLLETWRRSDLRGLERQSQLVHQLKQPHLPCVDTAGAQLDRLAGSERARQDPPADARCRLQHTHVLAGPAQPPGSRQPGQAGTDHDHFGGLQRHRQVFQKAKGKR